MALTKATVDGARAGERDAFLWDDRLRGFGLKVTPAGSKVYVVQYRAPIGKAVTRRYTIGRHGSPWTPASARAEAERILLTVAGGVDPASQRAQRREVSEPTEFAAYAARFVELYGRRRWRAGTLSGAESNLTRWIVPVLQGKDLKALRRSDIAAVFDRLPSSSPALPRNLHALLRRLLSWAVERGDLDRSPMDGLKSPSTVASRDRVLTDAELLAIWSAAGLMAGPFGFCVRMLILTGQRRDEIASLRWHEVDRASALLTLARERTKNGREHLVPLSDAAVSELDAIAGSDLWPTSGFVFTTNGRAPVSGFSKMKARLDDMVNLKPWRIHDLRRTVATGLQRLGVRFEVTEAVLNHVGVSGSGIAAVYQRHDWRRERQEALEAWASHVRSIVQASAPLGRM